MNAFPQRAWGTLIFSFLAGLTIWLAFTWPLPRYALRGIPSSARSAPDDTPRVLVPGDHLQMLYHFWLLHDMLRGRTPFFHNLYEFNLGDDAARYEPGSYYVPSSLFYALAATIGGRAFGYNAATFVAVWLTLLFTLLLLRRLTRDTGAAWLAALAAIALPYSWISMLGGSPTGFAMPWIPLLLYGLDVAIRDRSIRGGCIAGLALLLASWSDTHVFFFTFLFAPVWCVIILVASDLSRLRSGGAWRRLLLALAPAVALAVCALLFNRWLAGDIAQSHMATGRSWQEVALFAPRPAGLFARAEQGASNQIYLGLLAPVVLCLGLLATLRNWRARTGHVLLLALTCIAVAGIVLLALGPHAPGSGFPLRVARKLVPHYDLIRQPGKIFCLMPALLAVGLAVSWSAWRSPGALQRVRALLPALTCAALLLEYGTLLRPSICLLPTTQPAYESVAADAAASGAKPRALVVTLWPSDSHFSSVYQFCASLHRVRLVNGYSAVVSGDYFDNVFLRLESVNLGLLSASQMDFLLQRDIRYLILHEDLFPEKVSPFPVTFTLRNLVNHPRLELLRQDGAVWAFKLVANAEARPTAGDQWNVYSPARWLEAERARLEYCFPGTDATASRYGFVALPSTQSGIRSPALRLAFEPDLRLLTRARGQGSMEVRMEQSGSQSATQVVAVNARRWTWYEIPIEPFEGMIEQTWAIHGLEGTVEVDLLMLTAGRPLAPAPGGIVELPAPCFFHAGYTDLHDDSIVLRGDWDPALIAFYGPKLPLPPGDYRMHMELLTDAPSGTVLGEWTIRDLYDASGESITVRAGEPAVLKFTRPDNLPFHAGLRFDRKADLRIRNIVIERLR